MNEQGPLSGTVTFPKHRPIEIKINGPVNSRQASPTLFQKAINLGKATVTQVAAGHPLASDEQVEERFKICSGNECGFFKLQSEGSGVCIHRKCGCSMRQVERESSLRPNKLRWATQSCPVGLWGPIVPLEQSGSAGPIG